MRGRFSVVITTQQNVCQMQLERNGVEMEYLRLESQSSGVPRVNLEYWS